MLNQNPMQRAKLLLQLLESQGVQPDFQTMMQNLLEEQMKRRVEVNELTLSQLAELLKEGQLDVVAEALTQLSPNTLALLLTSTHMASKLQQKRIFGAYDEALSMVLSSQPLRTMQPMDMTKLLQELMQNAMQEQMAVTKPAKKRGKKVAMGFETKDDAETEESSGEPVSD